MPRDLRRIRAYCRGLTIRIALFSAAAATNNSVQNNSALCTSSSGFVMRAAAACDGLSIPRLLLPASRGSVSGNHVAACCCCPSSPSSSSSSSSSSLWLSAHSIRRVDAVVVGGRNGGGVAKGRQFLSSGSSSAGDRRKCCSRTNLWSKPGEGIPVGEFGQRIVVPEYDEDEDVDGEGEIKLECDESGCVIVMEKFKTLAEEAGGDGYLRCDLTGCYFADEPAPVKSFEVIEGEGWRLGYETAPESEESFCAIIGAGGWSVALTASEFNDFCNLIQTLRKGISTMDEDGVIGKDEVVMQVLERRGCNLQFRKVERGSVWMECSIPKKQVAIFQNLWKRGSRALIDSQQKTAFELRFILSGASGRRQAEGFWPPEAVMDMLKKVDAATLELQYKAQKAAAASA